MSSYRLFINAQKQVKSIKFSNEQAAQITFRYRKKSLPAASNL